MRKLLRWSAVLTAVLLVLAACTPAGTGESAGESTAESAAATLDPAAVCAADEFGCVEFADGDPIIIGTALANSGDVAPLGLDSEWGAQVAAQFKNEAGGVLGHDAEFIHQDAGCGDAATGQTAAQALVAEQDRLVAVIGTSCSRTAVTAAPLFLQEGIVLISPANTSPTLTDPENAEYAGEFFMRTAHNDLVQGAAMATYVCDELGFTKAATIHDGSTYADNLRQVFEREFAEQCSGETVAQQAITVGDTEFTAVLTDLAAGAPEIIYYPVFHPEGTLITQQARDFPGLEDVVLSSADGLLGSPDLTSQAGADAEGMILSGPACAGDEYENTFLPAYRDISGEETPVSVFHCHAYDATNMIFAAIEEVGLVGADGTLFIPRQAFRDAMYATSGFEGLTGSLTCDEFGDCADPKIAVHEIQNGEYVRIWP